MFTSQAIALLTIFIEITVNGIEYNIGDVTKAKTPNANI